MSLFIVNVEIGLSSAEDVDTSIKMGMALRFPVWGPLEHIDAVGPFFYHIHGC